MTYSWLCMYIARSAIRAEIILLFCTVRDQLSCPSDTLIFVSAISAIRAQVVYLLQCQISLRAQVTLLFFTVQYRLLSPNDTLIYYSARSAIRAQVILSASVER
jgi:hypothetical protein